MKKILAILMILILSLGVSGCEKSIVLEEDVKEQMESDYKISEVKVDIDKGFIGCIYKGEKIYGYNLKKASATFEYSATDGVKESEADLQLEGKLELFTTNGIT